LGRRKNGKTKITKEMIVRVLEHVISQLVHFDGSDYVVGLFNDCTKKLGIWRETVTEIIQHFKEKKLLDKATQGRFMPYEFRRKVAAFKGTAFNKRVRPYATAHVYSVDKKRVEEYLQSLKGLCK